MYCFDFWAIRDCNLEILVEPFLPILWLAFYHYKIKEARTPLCIALESTLPCLPLTLDCFFYE